MTARQWRRPKRISGLKVPVFLRYHDADGEISERVVTVEEVQGIETKQSFTPIYIMGHCHLRNDYRTFRVDRIEVIADPLTGELIENIADRFPIIDEPAAATPLPQPPAKQITISIVVPKTAAPVETLSQAPRAPPRRTVPKRRKENAGTIVVLVLAIAAVLAYCQEPRKPNDAAPPDASAGASPERNDQEVAAPPAPQTPAEQPKPDSEASAPSIAPTAGDAPQPPDAAPPVQQASPQPAVAPVAIAPPAVVSAAPAADIDSVYSPRTDTTAVACALLDVRATVLSVGAGIPTGCYPVDGHSLWRVVEIREGLWRMAPSSDWRAAVTLWFDPHQMRELGADASPKQAQSRPPIRPTPIYRPPAHRFVAPVGPTLPAAPVQVAPAPEQRRQGGRAAQ